MNYGTNSFSVGNTMVYALLDYSTNRAIAWMHRTKTICLCFLGSELITSDIPEISKFINTYSFGKSELDRNSNERFLSVNSSQSLIDQWDVKATCTITRDNNSIRLTNMTEVIDFCNSNHIEICGTAVKIEFSQ